MTEMTQTDVFPQNSLRERVYRKFWGILSVRSFGSFSNSDATPDTFTSCGSHVAPAPVTQALGEQF
jgi:hypothetical protein